MADNSLTCFVPSVAAYLQEKLKWHSGCIIMDRSLQTAVQWAAVVRKANEMWGCSREGLQNNIVLISGRAGHIFAHTGLCQEEQGFGTSANQPADGAPSCGPRGRVVPSSAWAERGSSHAQEVRNTPPQVSCFCVCRMSMGCFRWLFIELTPL